MPPVNCLFVRRAPVWKAKAGRRESHPTLSLPLTSPYRDPALSVHTRVPRWTACSCEGCEHMFVFAFSSLICSAVCVCVCGGLSVCSHSQPVTMNLYPHCCFYLDI